MSEELMNTREVADILMSMKNRFMAWLKLDEFLVQGLQANGYFRKN